jgi:site-specific DNA-methyltransferase (adenine-specific)
VKPYFEDEKAGIVIYHGDCRILMPSMRRDLLMPRGASLFSDPPYGMGYEAKRGSDGSKRWGDDSVIGDDVPFDPSHLFHLGFSEIILWGANWYANRLPPSGGWLVWDKTPKGAKEGFTASHAELAWTNLCSSVRKFSLQWGGEARNNEPFYHPTQKPVALAAWMLREFPSAWVVDPYMGAGWIAEACRDAGARFIGIEIEERYCEIAAKRLSQEVLPFGARNSHD